LPQEISRHQIADAIQTEPRQRWDVI
jgi:hypothetical protein